MAKTHTQSQKSDRKAPDCLAWHVSQRGDKSYWNEVGAAWMHKDKCGKPRRISDLSQAS